MKYLVFLFTLIIFRHDNPDKFHQRIGKVFEPYLASLNLPDCEGAVVAHGWAITAAHCAIDLQKKLNHSAHQIIINEEKFLVKEVIIHPKFEDDIRYDISLIKFESKPSVNYKLADLYFDRNEKDKEVFLVGHGASGNGRWPFLSNDGKLRGGTNTISSVSDYWVQMKFDGPSSENTTDFECISGPSDSGGPAFIILDDQVKLVGLSSWQSTEETFGISHIYGVTEFYTRVSRHQEWICRYLP